MPEAEEFDLGPAAPGPSDNLISDLGAEFVIGALHLEGDSELVTCQVAAVAQTGEGIVVAVPHAAWHRQAARRRLPPRTLSRATLAEVLASTEADPREAHPVWKVKVWLGVLGHEAVVASVFSEEDQDADLVFVVAGSGGGSNPPARARPFADSLAAIASEHFAFLSAESQGGEEGGVDQRLKTVEDTLVQIHCFFGRSSARGWGCSSSSSCKTFAGGGDDLQSGLGPRQPLIRS